MSTQIRDHPNRATLVSYAAGTLAEQLVKEGDTVNVGAVIARIEAGGAAAAAPTPAAAHRHPG